MKKTVKTSTLEELTQLRKDATDKLNEYIRGMNKSIELQKELCERWLNTDEYLHDALLDWFDYNKAQKAIRLWDIIQNDLEPAQRNLVNLYHANGENMSFLTQFFIGEYKNAATIRVLLSNARTRIREIYKEKYGEYKK